MNKQAGKISKPLIYSIIAVVVIGGFIVHRSRTSSAQQVTTYEFGTVEKADVRNSVTASGTVQPWKVVDVKSNVAGRIDRLAVDLGDRVKEGDLIALIDPTDSEVAVIQSRSDVLNAQADVNQATVTNQVQPKLSNLNIAQSQASLNSAKRSVSQANASLNQIRQQLSTLQEVTIPYSVENAAADLDQAEANLTSAQAEFTRQTQLQQKGYTSRSEVEAAQARLETQRAAARNARQRQKTLETENKLSVQRLKAQIEQAEEAVAEAKSRVNQQQAALELSRENKYQDRLTKDELAATKARLDRSRAALRQAQTTLSYTRIVAPRDGIVTQKNVEEGTVVPSSRGSIGSTNALLQIGDTSILWVVCQVDETDIGQVAVGQRVSVSIDAYPGDPVNGKVIRVDPQARLEQNVTTIPVTVQLDNTDTRFKPGMNAECEFIIDEVENVLTVPNEALTEEKGKFSVQELKGEKLVKIPVKVGVSGLERTEVRGKLKPGQEVVTAVIEPMEESGNPLNFGPPQRRTGRPGQSGAQGGGQRQGQGGGGGQRSGAGGR